MPRPRKEELQLPFLPSQWEPWREGGGALQLPHLATWAVVVVVVVSQLSGTLLLGILLLIDTPFGKPWPVCLKPAHFAVQSWVHFEKAPAWFEQGLQEGHFVMVEIPPILVCAYHSHFQPLCCSMLVCCEFGEGPLLVSHQQHKGLRGHYITRVDASCHGNAWCSPKYLHTASLFWP